MLGLSRNFTAREVEGRQFDVNLQKADFPFFVIVMLVLTSISAKMFQTFMQLKSEHYEHFQVCVHVSCKNWPLNVFI